MLNLIDLEIIGKNDLKNDDIKLVCDKLFVFAALWAFGGSLSAELRLEFSEVLKTLKKIIPNPLGLW